MGIVHVGADGPPSSNASCEETQGRCPVQGREGVSRGRKESFVCCCGVLESLSVMDLEGLLVPGNIHRLRPCTGLDPLGEH
jgi:hypothetical protein